MGFEALYGEVSMYIYLLGISYSFENLSCYLFYYRGLVE